MSLVPDGAHKKVTVHNRLDYLRLLAKFHLCCGDNSSSNGSSADGKHSMSNVNSNGVDSNSTDNYNSSNNHCTNPIRECVLGVQDMCSRDLFSFLSVSALQLAVEGLRNVDIVAWRSNTNYSFLQTAANKEFVDMFWSVVEEMSVEDRRELLSFCVGTSSLPARGFEALSPHFTLTLVKTKAVSLNGTANVSQALPTSHTCFNTLVLPMYSNKEVMKQKLLQAIRETDVCTLGLL